MAGGQLSHRCTESRFVLGAESPVLAEPLPRRLVILRIPLFDELLYLLAASSADCNDIGCEELVGCEALAGRDECLLRLRERRGLPPSAAGAEGSWCVDIIGLSRDVWALGWFVKGVLI